MQTRKVDNLDQVQCGTEGHFDLHMFTDGSARKFSRKVTCAGWSLTAMKTYRNDGGAPIVSACGPVQTNEGGEFWVATRAKNNTAEMQAIKEALYWLHSGTEVGIFRSPAK